MGLFISAAHAATAARGTDIDAFDLTNAVPHSAEPAHSGGNLSIQYNIENTVGRRCLTQLV